MGGGGGHIFFLNIYDPKVSVYLAPPTKKKKKVFVYDYV